MERRDQIRVDLRGGVLGVWISEGEERREIKANFSTLGPSPRMEGPATY